MTVVFEKRRAIDGFCVAKDQHFFQRRLRFLVPGPRPPTNGSVVRVHVQLLSHGTTKTTTDQIVAAKLMARLNGTAIPIQENAQGAGNLTRLIQKLFSPNRESCSVCRMSPFLERR
jgi:hypothetical protein